jgi:hypothetical protein
MHPGFRARLCAGHEYSDGHPHSEQARRDWGDCQREDKKPGRGPEADSDQQPEVPVPTIRMPSSTRATAATGWMDGRAEVRDRLQRLRDVVVRGNEARDDLSAEHRTETQQATECYGHLDHPGADRSGARAVFRTQVLANQRLSEIATELMTLLIVSQMLSATKCCA